MIPTKASIFIFTFLSIAAFTGYPIFGKISTTAPAERLTGSINITNAVFLDSKIYCTASDLEFVSVLDAKSGKETNYYDLFPNIKRNLGFDIPIVYSEKHNLLVTGTKSFGIILSKPGEPLTKKVDIKGIASFALSPNQDRIAVGTWGGSGLQIYSFPSMKLERTLPDIKGTRTIAAHPTEDFFAVSDSLNGYFYLVSGQTGKASVHWKGKKQATEMVLAPDTRTLIIGFEDGSLESWDLFMGKKIQSFPPHKRRIQIIKVHPSGKYFATGGKDGMLAIRDINTGKILESMIVDENKGWGVRGIQFSQDGKEMFYSGTFAYLARPELFQNTTVAAKPTSVPIPANTSSASDYSSEQPVASQKVAARRKDWKVGETIQVKFRNAPGNAQDWITFVEVSAPANKWGQWKYLKGQTSGTFEPKAEKSGTYEIRLYYNWPDGGFEIQDKIQIEVHD